MKAGPSSTEYHATRIAHFSWGFTLIEQVVAAAVLAIAALGALQYEYFAAGHAQIARVQTAAARAAQLLIEDWKSTGGSDEYDPASLGLGFSNAGDAPAEFATSGGLGNALNGSVYRITLCDVPVLMMPAYTDVSTDDVANIILRQIAVVVRYGQSQSGDAGPDSRFADLPPMTFVTYVRLDATDG